MGDRRPGEYYIVGRSVGMVNTSNTENERNGLGMNMHLEKFVGLLCRLIWPSKFVYHDPDPRSLHQNDDVHPEAQRDISSRY